MQENNKEKNYKPVNTNKVAENSSPFTGVLGWLDNRLPIFRMFKHEYLDFQVPKNLNYWWSFGAILTFTLLGLIITGLILAYVPRIVLWIIQGTKTTDVDFWSDNIFPYDGNSILRIHFAMGTNELLGSHCDNKFIQCHSFGW